MLTIIIPVWNHLDLTVACIRRLRRYAPTGPTQIIVVDNGSTDGTGQWLSRQDDLVVLSNEENLGFARACNIGAARAQGDVLLFLNNDVLVEPGFAEPLLEVLNNDARVGMVGAQLLYPRERTVQHAGVLLREQVVSDGRRVLVGDHRDRGLPEGAAGVNTPLIIQVVTAAMCAVRREAFEHAGGFDDGYWNGNEDVDLCLKLGDAGWSVVYEPRSLATHFESSTSEERWTKVSQNIERLTQRWLERVVLDVVSMPSGAELNPESPISVYVPPPSAG